LKVGKTQVVEGLKERNRYIGIPFTEAKMNSRFARLAISVAIAVSSLVLFITVVGGIASSMSDEATVIVSGVDKRDGIDNRLLLSQRPNISQDGGLTLTEPDSYYLPLIEFDNIALSLERTALIALDNSTKGNNQETIIYVDVYNTGFEDGTQAHPFNTIQEAIDYASDGNIVLVFPGVYVENVTIHGKSVNLRSHLGPQMTVIDGSAQKSVIQIFEESSPTDAVIDGFTIRNGGGSSGLSGDGFGVLMALNLGSSGMGISATIQNNIITGNNLRGGVGIISSTMGEHFEISIINNLIIENSARDAIGGAGITVDVPEPTGFINVENNVIANNAGYSGGGLRFVSGDSNFMINVLNNTIYSNTAEYGGGIAANASNVSLINNIFFLNSAQQEGNDLYLVQAGLSANVSFNIIGDGQFAGVNGNISSDPLLVNPFSENFQLLALSPAIDSGVNMDCPETDFLGTPRPLDGNMDGVALCDMGAYEYAVPLSSILIDGPSTGNVQVGYTFTANVGPITTTLPITYVWQVTDQAPVTHTNSLTDSIAYSWILPGNYVLNVTATNPPSTVTDTHTITITDVPISGLTTTNDSPTSLGNATTLSVTLSTGTNVTYTWDLGDGSSANGAFITHTYPFAEVFTATVTVSNSVGSVQASTIVNVVIPETKLFIPIILHAVPLNPEAMYWRRQEPI
jgi:hypothetical protein